MPSRKPETFATREDVARWISEGVFRVVEGKPAKVYKGERELAQRINKRNRCDHGDARVDLYHEGKRRSVHVSALVWTARTGVAIPEDFEIHHRDEDIENNHFDNFLCLHYLDHRKLHETGKPVDNTPF